MLNIKMLQIGEIMDLNLNTSIEERLQWNALVSEYHKGDVVVFWPGISGLSKWGVVEKLEWHAGDIMIGIRSYYSEDDIVDYWVHPNDIIKKLNKYRLGQVVMADTILKPCVITDIRKAPFTDDVWYTLKNEHWNLRYCQVPEDCLILETEEKKIMAKTENKIFWDMHFAEASGHITPYIQHLSINKVIFNDPATIIIWQDGTKTVVKTAPGETYNEWAGLALCICKRLYGDKFHKIFKDLCPEKEKEDSIKDMKKEIEALKDDSKDVRNKVMETLTKLYAQEGESAVEPVSKKDIPMPKEGDKIWFKDPKGLKSIIYRGKVLDIDLTGKFISVMAYSNTKVYTITKDDILTDEEVKNDGKKEEE